MKKNILLLSTSILLFTCTTNKTRTFISEPLDNQEQVTGETILLPSGLKYKVVVAGIGAKPKITDKVRVHYHGTLEDGTIFDSSIERGTPLVFRLNQVIKGWQEGLQLMKEGAVYELYIPSKLAYGAKGSGKIPPFSNLNFRVELLEVL